MYGTGGVGTTVDAAAVMFNHMAGTDLQRVSYKGAAPALQDLLAGRIHVMFDNVSQALPFIKDGKLRALGVTSADRWPALDSVPTIAEQGYPGYDLKVWWGISGPKGMPAAVVDKLTMALGKALKNPSLMHSFSLQGVLASTSSPKEFADLYAADYQVNRKLFKASE